MNRLLPVLLLLLCAPAPAAPAGPPYQPQGYRDGHARPRALLYNPADRLLYAALSTADRVALIDAGPPARVVATVPSGPFPQALAALPGGGVLVSCRFDPDLGVIEPGTHRYRRLPAGPEHGHRGIAVNAERGVVYVASPPLGGVKIVALDGRGVLQTVPTGAAPRALLRHGDLLLVSNFISHTVTAHRIGGDGLLSAAIQSIGTDAPVQELAVAPAGPGEGPSLLLLTHEDRPVDRQDGPVTGLDSVVLALPLAPGPRPFGDPGPGRRRRRSFNLTERPVSSGLLAKLDAVVYDPARKRLWIAGAATDNLLVSAGLPGGDTVPVGANPVALALLPDGRVASADRLSDTVSLVTLAPDGRPEPATQQVVVGEPRRDGPAERGELLFYGRALVPNNVADGPLSVYACSACHDDGHVDGRLHPARRNRFRSMTKTCRGLATTAPYLSLGEIGTLKDFADNILSTHAQGEERAPRTYDWYPVTLRLRGVGPGWRTATLSPQQVRQAMAAYLARIPAEPSPFVPPGSRTLPAQAQRGLGLFLDRCARCHQTVGNSALGNRVPEAELPRRILRRQVAFTSTARFDVGTPVLGRDGNNPPSLRGVWQAAPYLSDGSARTLEALLLRTDPDAEQVHAAANALPAPRMSADERAALLAFLRSL